MPAQDRPPSPPLTLTCPVGVDPLVCARVAAEAQAVLDAAGRDESGVGVVLKSKRGTVYADRFGPRLTPGPPKP